MPESARNPLSILSNYKAMNLFTKISTVIVASSALIALAGCSSKNERTVLSEMFGGLATSFQQKDPYPRSRPEINAYPFAQMGVRIDKNRRGIVVLQALDGPRELWVSADGLVLQMDHGRIGLAKGPEFQGQLAELSPHDPLRDYLNTGEFSTQPYQKSVLIGSEPNITQVIYSCSMKQTGAESVEIVDDQIESTVFEETCALSGRELNVETQRNQFWVSVQRPYVWRSVQKLDDALPTFTLEMLKRPG